MDDVLFLGTVYDKDGKRKMIEADPNAQYILERMPDNLKEQGPGATCKFWMCKEISEKTLKEAMSQKAS